MSKFQNYVQSILSKVSDVPVFIPTTINNRVVNLGDYRNITLDEFAIGTSDSNELDEINAFGQFTQLGKTYKKNIYEFYRSGKQQGDITIHRQDGEVFDVVSFSLYNYLGLANDPRVIEASKSALNQYGLGAGASPILGGKLAIHEELEASLVQFFGLKDRKVSLFSNGYAVNVGTLSAFLNKGHYAVLDSCSHISLIEGARASGAKVIFFEHNNMESLEKVLMSIQTPKSRILICTEGVYSGEGDFGCIQSIVKLAKQYGAYTLVDEAHSVLLTGEKGRGVSSMQGVLDQIDLFVFTMSKAFGGIGGAVLAKPSIAQYINFYAKSRMFSCAMSPVIAGGMIESLKIAGSEEGDALRKKLIQNAALFRSKLEGKVDVGNSQSWIIPVMFYSEKINIELFQYLHREGLDCGNLIYPSVPKGKALLRFFVTTYHTEEHIEKAASVVLKASEKFKFDSLK